MIEAKHTSFSNKGQKNILKDISLKVNSGEFLALVGPNGAGKSTLLNILAGNIEPTNGNVFLNNQNINTFTACDLAQRRAVLSQECSVSSNFSVHDLVMMGRYNYFKNKPKDSDLIAVKDSLYNVGIQHLKNRNINSLSGGEKQRVHLARVLAQLCTNSQQKGILFLDEPTNNLDLQYQYKMLALAKEKSVEGHTIISVLHDLNLASRYADRILVLKDGQKKADDLPKEVLQSDLLTEVYQMPLNIINHKEHLMIVPV